MLLVHRWNCPLGKAQVPRHPASHPCPCALQVDSPAPHMPANPVPAAALSSVRGMRGRRVSSSTIAHPLPPHLSSHTSLLTTLLGKPCSAGAETLLLLPSYASPSPSSTSSKCGAGVAYTACVQ